MYETWLDREIRLAQERGDFDNLPGSGQPLPDHGELYDEEWWIKQWVRREQITGFAPATLLVKREAEDLLERLAAESSEATVRRIVTELNQRIDRAVRSQLDGPPVVLTPFDVDAVVESWRRSRSA
jgi:hypothetical protein